MLMEMFLKGNLLMIKKMDLDCLEETMENCMKVSITTIKGMVMAN
jgi:hypothetical protein